MHITFRLLCHVNFAHSQAIALRKHTVYLVSSSWGKSFSDFRNTIDTIDYSICGNTDRGIFIHHSVVFLASSKTRIILQCNLV